MLFDFPTALQNIILFKHHIPKKYQPLPTPHLNFCLPPQTPGGERWYADSLRLTYNSSARILEHAANQGRKVTLSTEAGELLFPTPVGKSFSCPEETVIELAEEDAK